MDASPSLRVASPAARIPSLPGLPLLGNALDFRRDRLEMAQRLAALGPMARFHIGPVAVCQVTDASLAHEILVEQADAFGKSRGLAVFLKPVLGDGLLSAEGDAHRRARKLLAPAFAAKRVAGYAEVMAGEAVRAAVGWRDGARIDAADEMMKMTLAIVGRTLFDADVRGEAAVIGEALTEAMEAMIEGFTSPVQLSYRWPLPRHRKMRRAVAMLDRVVYRIITERRAAGGDRGDVLSVLLAARDDDGSGFDDRQVRDEVMTLLLAGHETTANALAWTLYLLADHPAVRAVVEAEVDEVLAGRPPTAADLPRLPRTLAAIEEAMRLYPPAYMVGRAALRDVTIGGHRFAPGSTLVVNIMGIHRRPDYFPDPLAFRLERFDADAKKARPRGHYLPFGAGPRVCIGNHFALMEAQLALAALVQQVRLDRVGHGPVTPEPMVTLRPRGGVPMRVVRRDRTAA